MAFEQVAKKELWKALTKAALMEIAAAGGWAAGSVDGKVDSKVSETAGEMVLPRVV
jgi:hypothetical protein